MTITSNNSKIIGCWWVGHEADKQEVSTWWPSQLGIPPFYLFNPKAKDRKFKSPPFFIIQLPLHLFISIFSSFQNLFLSFTIRCSELLVNNMTKASGLLMGKGTNTSTWTYIMQGNTLVRGIYNVKSLWISFQFAKPSGKW